MKTRALVAIAALFLIIPACASSGSTAPRSQYNEITAAEIEAANVSNLYQLVERLRPRWLDVRSRRSFNATTSIVVFEGQSLLGGVEMLRQLGTGGITRLEYLDGPTASATLPGLGMRQVEAAIVVNPL